MILYLSRRSKVAWFFAPKPYGFKEKSIEAPWQTNSNATLKFLKIIPLGKSEKHSIRLMKQKLVFLCRIKLLFREFDPGSGWTLAACLTHASRTGFTRWRDFGQILGELSGGRVSNAWATCLTLGDSSWKRLVIPHKRTVLHGTVWKTPVVWDGPASD